MNDDRVEWKWKGLLIAIHICCVLYAISIEWGASSEICLTHSLCVWWMRWYECCEISDMHIWEWRTYEYKKIKFISSQGAYTLCRYAQFSHRIASSSSNCVDMICNDDEWCTCTDDSQLSTPDLAGWFVWTKQQTGEREKNECKGSLISSVLWLPQPVADAVAALI